MICSLIMFSFSIAPYTPPSGGRGAKKRAAVWQPFYEYVYKQQWNCLRDYPLSHQLLFNTVICISRANMEIVFLKTNEMINLRCSEWLIRLIR